MRCYVINSATKKAYRGSEKDARQLKAEWLLTQGLKRKDVSVEPVDIPTTKEDLLAWLNANATN